MALVFKYTTASADVVEQSDTSAIQPMAARARDKMFGASCELLGARSDLLGARGDFLGARGDLLGARVGVAQTSIAARGSCGCKGIYDKTAYVQSKLFTQFCTSTACTAYNIQKVWSTVCRSVKIVLGLLYYSTGNIFKKKLNIFVTQCFVLTAGHCMSTAQDLKGANVYLGSHIRSSGGTKYGVLSSCVNFVSA